MVDAKKILVGVLVAMMCASNMVHTSFAQTQEHITEHIKTERIRVSERVVKWAIDNNILEESDREDLDSEIKTKDIQRMLIKSFRNEQYENSESKESFEEAFGKENYHGYIVLNLCESNGAWFRMCDPKITRGNVINVLVDEMNWLVYPDDSEVFEYDWLKEDVFNALQTARRAGLITEEQLRNKEWITQEPTKAEVIQWIYNIKNIDESGLNVEQANMRDDVLGKYNILSPEAERVTVKVREIEKEFDDIGEDWLEHFFKDGWNIEIIKSINETYNYKDRNVVGLTHYRKKKLIFTPNSSKGTAYHEFGHYIQNEIGENHTISTSWFNKYIDYMYDTELESFAPTDYSKKSYKEWFAECYRYAMDTLSYKESNNKKYESRLESFTEKAPLLKELIWDNIITYDGLYDEDAIDAKVEEFKAQNPDYYI